MVQETEMEGKSVDKVILAVAPKYESFFKKKEFRKRISDSCIKRSIEAAFEEKEGKLVKDVVLRKNNYAEISFKDKSIEKIHYRVTQYRPSSKYPWYSITIGKMEQLKEDKISRIICLFYGENKTRSVPTYYRFWKCDEICTKTSDWNYSVGKAADLYRWNPGKDFENYMTRTKVDKRI